MKFKLLLVDNDEYLLNVHRKYFDCAGYDVDCATTETDALALIDRNRYAAIVCDLHLDSDNSNQQGLAFASKAKILRPGAAFFILTSHVSYKFERNALSRGVYMCLTKPQPLSKIKEAIEFAIAHDPLGSQRELPSRSGRSPVLNFDGLQAWTAHMQFDNLLKG